MDGDAPLSRNGLPEFRVQAEAPRSLEAFSAAEGREENDRSID